GRQHLGVRAGGRHEPGHRTGAGLLPAGDAAAAPVGPGAAGRGHRGRRVARHRAGVRRPAGIGPGADRRSGMTARPTLRVGNASGFYGDRASAWLEMLTSGPLDVLTGDYLAELTMLILGRDRLKDPGLG